jgi:hypothetical protein
MPLAIAHEFLHERAVSLGEGEHGVRRAKIDADGMHECFRK